jgi:hypothetical protein
MADDASHVDLVSEIGSDAADALRDWQAANGFRIQVPIVSWKAKEGFTGASLHAVVVHDGTQMRHLVLKCVPPWTDGAFGVQTGREPARHRQAYVYNEEFSRLHLVTQPFPALLTRAKKVLMFQSFAADGGDRITLNGLPRERLASACAEVVRTTSGTWPRGAVDGDRCTVHDLLWEEMGGALKGSGTIVAWARTAGLLNFRAPGIRFAKDGSVFPNPLLPAFQNLSFADRMVYRFGGPVHGDLHLDNVLLPVGRDGAPSVDEFRLIDLATFNDAGSLTRDPVRLMLSAIANTFDTVSAEHEDALIQAVLDPMTAVAGSQVPFAVAQAVRSAYGAAIGAHGAGLTPLWTDQFLLSVQGQALVFTSFSNQAARLRFWFLRLAAAAAQAVAASLKANAPLDPVLDVAQPFHDSAPLAPVPAVDDPGPLPAGAARAALSAARDTVNATGATNPARAVEDLKEMRIRAEQTLVESDELIFEIRRDLARWTRLAGDTAAAELLEQRNYFDAADALGDQHALTRRCFENFWHRPA